MRTALFVLITLLTAWTLSACGSTYQGPVTDHFDGKRFFTPGVNKSSSPVGYLWRRLTDPPPDWPQAVPAPANLPALLPRVIGNEARVTYIGHATLLVQVAGLNILTDPVWSQRASAVQWLGPKRVAQPAWLLEQLPPIDVVLISHDHYDHLDVSTLRKLDAAHRPRVIAPLGVQKLLVETMPQSKVSEHDWGERVMLAQGAWVHVEGMAHGSGRTPFDQMQTLWAAYVIEAAGIKMYHAGDAGYAGGKFFRDTAKRHGPLDLAILPIGAYEPVDFMADSHMSPSEAVQALIDTGARQGLAHHFDTFQLGFEGFGAAGKALIQAMKIHGLPAQKMIIPTVGQAVLIQTSPP
jgi:L-ascorbate metabolism protein UlaG (beta-lactamase superfamily)